MDELKQLEKIQELERQIAGLPIGYISKKTINGKVRYYHQWTENRKKHSQYLRDGEMEVLQEQIGSAQVSSSSTEGTAIRHAESAPAQVGF